MILSRQLADLRHIVHIRTLTVGVKDMLIGRILNKFQIIVIQLRLLNETLVEAELALFVPDMVHLTDTAGVIACSRHGGIEALALIHQAEIVVAVARARRILPRQQ